MNSEELNQAIIGLSQQLEALELQGREDLKKEEGCGQSKLWAARR